MHIFGAYGREAGKDFNLVMSAAFMTRDLALHGIFPRNTPLSRLVLQLKDIDQKLK